MALIKCKECGTEISSKAEICPKCGAAGTKKTSMLTWIVAGFFVLVFIGWCSSQMDKRPPITTDNAIDQTSVESLTTISAHDLALAYDQNTVQADQRFKGKRFKITGIVVDINTDFLDRPYLVLDGGVNQFMNPQFAFDKGQVNILANIKKGDRVVLICRVKGDIIKTPMSEACSFSTERSEAQNSNTSQPMQQQETDELTPLENGLSCKDTPKPYEIISQLLKAKEVSKTDLGYDSIAYFKAIKPLYVWGLKVKYIYGHDEEVGEPYYSKVFARAPGTSPGHFIGVIVAEPIDSVKGKLAKFNFKKMNIGYEEEEFGIPAGANISCHRSHDLTDDPAPVKQAIAVPSVNNSGIETTIRNYYQSIQDKRFEEAIKAFSTEKIPKLNIDLIVRIGKNTEYYKIDSINVTSNDGTHAQTTVRLRHKKYNNYEENWEIYISLINENGVWKIVSTPGRKL